MNNDLYRSYVVGAVKKHAEIHELQSTEFLDMYGKPATTEADLFRIVLTFIDGKEFSLSTKEFAQFFDFKFMIRPAKDNG